MLDKSVPHISVIMVNHDATNYPEFHLPAGYSFCFYKDGLEEDWCRLQLETGQVLSMDSIRARFETEFGNEKEKLTKRCIFVKAPNGEIIGTAMLWDGNTFGKIESRIHWVAVLDSHGGKGIAKALLSVHTLGFRGEALPSIASVSHLAMETSTGETKGTSISLEGGKIIEQKSGHARKGTQIEVSHISI